MCGIFGLFGETDEGFISAAISLADEGLFHRGPDFGSSVVVGQATLVARRLAIIDRSENGSQPMCTPDRRHWLIYNGMLYNHRELREFLRHEYTFRGDSDTEVVLAALSQWGLSALRRFEGMFSFLWWDAHKSSLIGAVDPLGIKPLLYRNDRSGSLACSSELGPLLDLFPDSSIDTGALGAYLSAGVMDHSRHTLISNVYQLRGGEYLQWDQNGFSINRYSELLRSDAVAEEPVRDDDIRNLIHDALVASVARHVQSDVPVSLGVSSGLDSNLLRIFLEDVAPEVKVQSFTYTFPGTSYDEWRRLADLDPRAARRSTKVPITPQMVIDQLPGLIAGTLEPLGGLGTFGLALNHKAASEHGFRVMLSGEGADDLFGGYSYFLDAPKNQRNRRSDGTQVTKTLASDGSEMTRPTLQSGFVFDSPLAEFGTPAERKSHGTPLRRQMLTGIVGTKLPKLLKFRDRFSMHYGVEARVPFLDQPLVQLSSHLSDSHLVRNGQTKVILRDIAISKGLSHFTSKKIGQPNPQREWVKGALGAWILGLLTDSALVKAGILDADGFRQQMTQYMGSSDLGNSFFAWQFANIELWMRAVQSRCENGRLAAHRSRSSSPQTIRSEGERHGV